MTVSEANSSWILENIWIKQKNTYSLLHNYFLLSHHLLFMLILFPGTVFLSEDHFLCWPMPCPLLSLFWFHCGISGDTAWLQSVPHSISFINCSYQFSVTLMSHWVAGNSTAGLKQDRTGRTQAWIEWKQCPVWVTQRPSNNSTLMSWSPASRKSINIKYLSSCTYIPQF